MAFLIRRCPVYRVILLVALWFVLMSVGHAEDLSKIFVPRSGHLEISKAMLLISNANLQSLADFKRLAEKAASRTVSSSHPRDLSFIEELSETPLAYQMEWSDVTVDFDGDKYSERPKDPTTGPSTVIQTPNSSVIVVDLGGGRRQIDHTQPGISYSSVDSYRLFSRNGKWFSVPWTSEGKTENLSIFSRPLNNIACTIAIPKKGGDFIVARCFHKGENLLSCAFHLGPTPLKQNTEIMLPSLTYLLERSGGNDSRDWHIFAYRIQEVSLDTPILTAAFEQDAKAGDVVVVGRPGDSGHTAFHTKTPIQDVTSISDKQVLASQGIGSKLSHGSTWTPTVLAICSAVTVGLLFFCVIAFRKFIFSRK